MICTVENMLQTNDYVSHIPPNILKSADTVISLSDKRTNAVGFLTLCFCAQTAGLMSLNYDKQMFLLGLTVGSTAGIVAGICKEVVKPTFAGIAKDWRDFAVCTAPIKSPVKCILTTLTLLYTSAIAYGTCQNPKEFSLYNGAVIGLITGYTLGSLKMQFLNNIGLYLLGKVFEPELAPAVNITTSNSIYAKQPTIARAR